MSPITGQAQAALMSLQSQALGTTDNFHLERIDRALDEIIRLNSTQSYGRQVRSAMAHGLQVMQHRRGLASCEPIEARQVDPAATDNSEVVIDLRLWLRDTTRITEQQRRLLALLADDYDADELAALYRVPPPRMRERVARARKAARASHDADMNID